jgi:phenylpropionate dioxygenase-like ring-hydroxylating dioxygenase large terminal subunit
MREAIPVRERLRSEIERFDPQLDIEIATPPPGAWYIDARFLELEQHTTFSRHWQFVGRSGQVSATGSFFTGTVLNRPYLVVRDEDDELRAFYNVRAHHGTRVASGCGSASEFTCPYHDGPLDEKVLARALDDSKQVQQEDTEIVSLVQEGLASGAYEGLYAPRLEQPMLQFHRMLAADFAAQTD